MIGPHARDPKVIGSHAGDTTMIGPLACDLNMIGSDAGDPNVIGGRPRAIQIFGEAPDSRRPTTGRSTASNFITHRQQTTRLPHAASSSAARGDGVANACSAAGCAQNTCHFGDCWPSLPTTTTTMPESRQKDDADWTAFGADQMATARDLLQAEGRTLNDWVQFDEASADWVPLTLPELKQLSDGVHRGSDSTAAGDRTCPVCLEDLEGKVLLRTGCCQQQFCAACLWMHAGASRCCPLCRRHLLSGAPMTTKEGEEEDASDSDSVASDQAPNNNNNDDDDDMGVPSTSGGRRQRRSGGRTGPSCSGFGSFGPPSSDSTDGSFLTQTGRGRRRTPTKEAEADDNDDDDGGEVVDDFFTVVGVWERAGSRSRATQTETIQVRFHNWERARRPDLLLARCIARLMARVLDGRAEPLRVGLSVQPPGWDNCFHVPMRPPQQNSAHALAAALENIRESTARVEGACAEDEQRARGTVRCQSFVPVVNGAGGDRWCMARAIVLGLAQRRICVLEHRNVVHFRAFCLAQRGEAGAPEARRLLEDAAVPLDRPTYGAIEAQRVQRWLDASLGPHQVRLIIFARELAYRIAWKGARPARFNLCLVAQDGHYGYIQCPEQLFHARQYCVDCEQPVDRRTHPQGCRALCPQCLRFGWGRPCAREPGHAPSRCADCLFVFENADCFEAHRRRVDPPPPGWQHDRRRGRPHRPMCEERRVCARCRQVVWTRHGAHACALNNNVGRQQAAQQQCARCFGIHDAQWTPHFIQPKRAQCQLIANDAERPPVPAEDLEDDDDNDDDDDDDDNDDGVAEPNRRRRPLRFLFWDVECAQVADEDEEEGDEEVPARVLKHVPLLVCAEVICERCVAAGVDLEREPDRRAPGCCCGGAAWRDGQHRQWLMRAREDAFSDDEDENAVAGGGRRRRPNPRRLRFFHDAATGRTPMAQFADFVLHDGPVNVRTVMLAHNGGRYDVHLLMEELQRRGVRPRRLVATGLRVYTLELGGRNQRSVVAKDSLNFFGCALSKLPAMFGLDGVPDKPFFPYNYIRAENMDVAHVGLPPAADYDPDRMRPAERDAFQRWYAEEQQRRPHRLFVLRRELLRYCANDVRILRRACLRFRQVVGELSGGVEPFLAATTIAGLALAIYRQRHLPRDLMVHTPEGGFLRGRRASAASRHFFALLERLRPQWRGRLRTARWSIGEACVEDDGYRLDALLYRPVPLRPLVIEFNGCFFHGCPECYPRRHQVLAGGQTAESLCARTRQQRAWELEQQHGFTVRAVWEVRVPAVCRAVPGPMDLRRDALFGGRVEPFALHYTCTEREEIDALDIVSLYPFVMKYRAFPVGLPRVLSAEQLDRDAAVRLPWTSAEQNPFRGFLHCRVLPPRPAELGDRHALLPYRTRTGRLTFPLCAACAEWANVDNKVQRHHRTVPRCRHRAAQRAWTHAYTDVELNAALQLGYRVLALYEVWHYDRWASKEAGNSLFAGYVDTMLRLKVEASGWPADCQTVEQRARYVARYADRGGHPTRGGPRAAEPGAARGRQGIAEFPMGQAGAARGARRRVLHGQRARVPRAVGRPAPRTWSTLSTSTSSWTGCVVRRRWPFVRAPDTNNLAVACFVTAHARLHLHGRLEEVRLAGGRMLYCDTDSVYFVRARRPPGPQQQQQFLRSEGDAFGQLMREWPGRRIVQFFSAGPKNYGFRHRCAASGGGRACGAQGCLTRSSEWPSPAPALWRTKRAEVFTRRGTKLYQPVYTKGLVVALDDREAGGGAGNAYFTRPFGWYDYDDEEADRDRC
ncbi:hypothetical protein niasHS_004905 [Heterodera schachtii]|uniref:DNA-directed DNA polymerase n=1 Tax=Heterodera schachtii TaxID=97005 RepID=A0ABD2JKG7_HETSC